MPNSKRTVRLLLIIGVSLAPFADVAQATALKLKLTNKSTNAINAFSLRVKGDSTSTPVNRLSSPIAAGAFATLQFDPGGTACVFDLTFTFASGKTSAQPDTDLCQTDGIVIQ